MTWSTISNVSRLAPLTAYLPYSSVCATGHLRLFWGHISSYDTHEVNDH